MQEKSLIKKNILYFIEIQGITKYKFYKDTGITRGVLDQNNGMSEENIAKFLAYYNEVSPDWLLTGKGSMYREEGARQIVNGSGNQAIGGSTINVSESEIEYYRKRVSELEKLVEQKDKVIDVLSGK